MQAHILEKLWLSKEESQIYLFLIKNPKQTISDLSNKLLINRPKLYAVLPAMIESWLIWNMLVGKRKYYIAENPDIHHSYFQRVKNDFKLFIPEIKDIYGNNFKKPIFKHLHWKSGMKNIFLDIAHTLSIWDTFYRYSSRRNVAKTSILDAQWQEYKNLRDKKKLERMVITNDYLNSLKEKKLEKEVVVIPKDFDIFEDNITKLIYADKVAIIDYNTEECFVIESQIFANFERKIFQLLFRFLRNAK